MNNADKSNNKTMNTELKTYSKEVLFQVLSNIPLDIEGSNLSKVGLYPILEHDLEYMGQAEFKKATEEATEKDSKVLFTNVFLEYDSCDCNDGMCSHGSWVWQIVVMDDGKRYELEIVDNSIYTSFGEKTASITDDSSIYDFYRLCEMTGVKLEFSDYAHSLFQSCGLLPSELLKQRDELRDFLRIIISSDMTPISYRKTAKKLLES